MAAGLALFTCEGLIWSEGRQAKAATQDQARVIRNAIELVLMTDPSGDTNVTQLLEDLLPPSLKHEGAVALRIKTGARRGVSLRGPEDLFSRTDATVVDIGVANEKWELALALPNEQSTRATVIRTVGYLVSLLLVIAGFKSTNALSLASLGTPRLSKKPGYRALPSPADATQEAAGDDARNAA